MAGKISGLKRALSQKQKDQILVYSLAAGGLAVCGLSPLYGITWSILSLCFGVSLLVGVITRAAFYLDNSLTALSYKVKRTADKIHDSAVKFDSKLHLIDQLQAELVSTNQHIQAVCQEVTSLFNVVKERMATLDGLHEAILKTLVQGQDAIKVIEQSVSKLSDLAAKNIENSLGIVNEALKELKDEYGELARKAQEGVSGAEEDIQAFTAKLDQTLEKLDGAIITMGKAAQGGSDLLSPIRVLGDLIRSLRSRIVQGIWGKTEKEIPTDETSSPADKKAKPVLSDQSVSSSPLLAHYTQSKAKRNEKLHQDRQVEADLSKSHSALIPKGSSIQR